MKWWGGGKAISLAGILSFAEIHLSLSKVVREQTDISVQHHTAKNTVITTGSTSRGYQQRQSENVGLVNIIVVPSTGFLLEWYSGLSPIPLDKYLGSSDTSNKTV